MKAQLLQYIVFGEKVVDLLQQNRETLQELSDHLAVWETEKLIGLKFPRLRCLTATTRSKGQGTL